MPCILHSIFLGNYNSRLSSGRLPLRSHPSISTGDIFTLPSDIPIPAAKVSRLLTADPLIPDCGSWQIVGGVVATDKKVLERRAVLPAEVYERAYESDKPHKWCFPPEDDQRRQQWPRIDTTRIQDHKSRKRKKCKCAYLGLGNDDLENAGCSGPFGQRVH